MHETTRHYGRPPRPVVEPTLLTLVRHGQTTGNVRKLLSGISDDPLTPFGRKQAAAMGKTLAALILDGTLPPVHTLYVSPLQRARHTARTIAEPLGLTPVVREDLQEINFGAFEGMTEAEAIERFPDARRAFAKDVFTMDFQFPGGESRRGFHQRAKDVFADIVGRHPGEHVIIVAHGGILGIAIAYYMTGTSERWRDYVLANCSISRLTVQGDDVTLHAVNDVSHLADLTPEEAEVVAEIEELEEESARD
jgi:broad specificity phosphatase PhoE